MSKSLRPTHFAGLIAAFLIAGAALARPAPTPHNVIIFVADGLRYGMVTPDQAPVMAALKAEGVDFANSHSLFPTVTTANASAIATGHRLGDTGDYSNTLWAGLPALTAAKGSAVADMEDDGVLGEMNGRFGGNYLNETTLLAAARQAGLSTAAVGKLGPTAIQDVTARDGAGTVVIDDDTGKASGIPLAPEIAKALEAAGLGAAAPDRGANRESGDFRTPGTTTVNKVQGDWFTAVVTQVLLPRFKAAHKPFVMVVWSRDPDGTQHNQGDSLNKLVPGVNGPTSLAAIRNADTDLGRIRAALKALGLDQTTDVLVTADHGFSTVSRESRSSDTVRRSYADVVPGQLPPGFFAIDLANALSLPLWDARGRPVDPAAAHPNGGNALLGADPKHPDIVLGASSGSELIWFDPAKARALAPAVARVFMAQDYASAVFADADLGPIPGALTLKDIGLVGSARTPRPSMVVGFRSYSTGCAHPELCAAEVAETSARQGQGQHGSFSRADSRNFMAATGPDFRHGFVDKAPVSNADWAPTAARILGLKIAPHGRLVGRVMAEALKDGGAAPKVERRLLRSRRAAKGFVTEMQIQRAGGETYLDWAGAPGRVVKGGR